MYRGIVPVNLATPFGQVNPANYRMKFHHNHILSIWNINGYHIYKVNAVGRLNQLFSQRNSEVMLVEPLTFYNGIRVENLIALIERNPNDGSSILELQRFEASLDLIRPTTTFSGFVLSFASNREYLAVCMMSSIFVYSIGLDGNIIEGSERSVQTETNEHGICAISKTYLVYPCTSCRDSRGILDVRILGNKLARQTVIYAHKRNPVIALAFSNSETSLATASRNHIRVFSVTAHCYEWPLVYDFVIIMTDIPKVNFSRCAEYIVCSGKSPTIYIFRLMEENKLTNMRRVNSPQVHCNYSMTLNECYPIQKAVALRYVYDTLYVYVFNEYAVYELFWYDKAKMQFASFGQQHFSQALAWNVRPRPPPPQPPPPART